MAIFYKVKKHLKPLVYLTMPLYKLFKLFKSAYELVVIVILSLKFC